MPLKIDQLPPRLVFPDFFNTLPVDLLYTANEIVDMAGISETTLRVRKRTCPGCFIKIGLHNYWGNPKAITAYIKKYGK